MLLNFSSYGAAAPVSPSVPINSKTASGIAALCLKQLLFPCSLTTLDGFCDTAGVYLQLFDSITAPISTTTVPLASFQVANAGPLPSIFATLQPLTFVNGLYIAVSSTATVYTASAAVFSVFGTVEAQMQLAPLALTTGGDLTTGVFKRGFSRPGTLGTNDLRLFEALVINGIAAKCWLQLHHVASGSLQDGDVPEFVLPLLQSTATQLFNFGTEGLILDTPSTGGAEDWTIAVSSTVNTFTATAASSKIKLRYGGSV